MTLPNDFTIEYLKKLAIPRFTGSKSQYKAEPFHSLEYMTKNYQCLAESLKEFDTEIDEISHKLLMNNQGI